MEVVGVVDVDTSNNGCCFMSCLLEKKDIHVSMGEKKAEFSK